MRSTAEILDHHLKCFAKRDLDGVMADYSEDAVFLGPNGALLGRNAIQSFFQTIFVEFAKPGVSFSLKQQLIEREYAYIVWTAETVDTSLPAILL